jgi:hypothetical protein
MCVASFHPGAITRRAYMSKLPLSCWHPQVMHAAARTLQFITAAAHSPGQIIYDVSDVFNLQRLIN